MSSPVYLFRVSAAFQIRSAGICSEFLQLSKSGVHDLLSALVELDCDFVVPGSLLKCLDGALAVSDVTDTVPACIIRFGDGSCTLLCSTGPACAAGGCPGDIGLFGLIGVGFYLDGFQTLTALAVGCRGLCRRSVSGRRDIFVSDRNTFFIFGKKALLAFGRMTVFVFVSRTVFPKEF